MNLNDLQTLIPAVSEASKRLIDEYKQTTHPKLKMLDTLIVLSLVTFVIQIFYAQVAGKDPFNSLLAGVFCSLGQFALSGKIRLYLYYG